MPVALALALVLVAATVVLWELLAAGHTPAAAVPLEADDALLSEWAEAVQGRLPGAFAALQLARTGGTARERKPPVIHGAARMLSGGAEWRVEFPGAVISEDIEPSRLAGALNEGQILAEVAETEEIAPGWADVRVFQRDPLHAEEGFAPPWAPGTIPTCCAPGEVCWGMRRSGKHFHVKLLVPGSGAQCMLLGGIRGSGKSEAMMGLLAQVAAWGCVDITLVDLARHGLDLGRFQPLAEIPLVDDVKTLRQALARNDAIAHRRAKLMSEMGMRVLDQPTRTRRLRGLFIDEIHKPMGDPKSRMAITRAAQEHRAMGGFIIAATQYPTIAALGGEQFAGQFRAQMGYRACFKVASATEAAVILGKSIEGDGPHRLTTGPGSAVVDADEDGQVVIRTWRMTDEWMAAHIAALVDQFGLAA